MSKRSLRRRSAAVAFNTTLLLSIAAPAFAHAPPPTNGGNGAGQSGQCTGNPADRPASCGPKQIPLNLAAMASAWAVPWPILATTPTRSPRFSDGRDRRGGQSSNCAAKAQRFARRQQVQGMA